MNPLPFLAYCLVTGTPLRRPGTPPNLGSIRKHKGQDWIYMGVGAGWMPAAMAKVWGQ